MAEVTTVIVLALLFVGIMDALFGVLDEDDE